MSAELIALAERFSDATKDSRGRRTFSFDSYGLADFAAALSTQARASEAEDAARYRWLRNEAGVAQGSTPFCAIGEDDGDCMYSCGASLDFAIDEARSTGDAGRGETP